MLDKISTFVKKKEKTLNTYVYSSESEFIFSDAHCFDCFKRGLNFLKTSIIVHGRPYFIFTQSLWSSCISEVIKIYEYDFTIGI